MKYFGAHVSAAGGVENAPLNAREIGATAFAFFTRNQRQWVAKPLEGSSIAAFKRNCTDLGYTPAQILPHGSYLVNLGSPDKDLLIRSREAFFDEMHRCEQLGLDKLNFHPGSHLDRISEKDCLDIVAESINIVLDKTKGVTAVIENTSGQGSNIGYRFEHLREIIDRVDDKDRVGICIDTLHAFAAGYDLSSRKACDTTFAELNSVVGFRYLRGMHLNGALKPLGSRVDRHTGIDSGVMGLDVFRYIARDKRFDGIPLILETPDQSLWASEIALLKSFV